MSTPGWYPDPEAGPDRLRFWDGATWTEQVSPARGSREPVDRSPGGEPLASRWDRFLAEVVDGAILLPIVLVVGWPFLSGVLGSAGFEGKLGDALALRQAQVAAGPSSPWPLLGFLTVAMLLAVAYRVALWLWLGATWGQRLVGLRVRPWAKDGGLVVRDVSLRSGVQWIFLPVLAVPAAGWIALLWPVIDVAWTVRDPARRTLHDALSGTCVVSGPDEDEEWQAQLQPRSDLDLYEDQE